MKQIAINISFTNWKSHFYPVTLLCNDVFALCSQIYGHTLMTLFSHLPLGIKYAVSTGRYAWVWQYINESERLQGAFFKADNTKNTKHWSPSASTEFPAWLPTFSISYLNKSENQFVGTPAKLRQIVLTRKLLLGFIKNIRIGSYSSPYRTLGEYCQVHWKPSKYIKTQ